MQQEKLLQQEFFEVLKCGRGRAYLMLKQYPTIDFSSYIIEGALNNHAYDGQCESSRAAYLLGLIQLSAQQEKIRQAVLKGLLEEQEETWNLTQLFDLAKLYTLQGDAEAKETIYKRFLYHPIEGSDWVGAYEILELDGWKGLLYVAEKFGKGIAEQPDDWQNDFVIKSFQRNHPHLPVQEKLEEVAKTNVYIQLYLDNIKRTLESWKKHRPKKQVFATVVEEALQSKLFMSFKKVRALSAASLALLGQQLLLEKNPANIEKLLQIFNHHPFPFDPHFILQLPHGGDKYYFYFFFRSTDR